MRKDTSVFNVLLPQAQLSSEKMVSSEMDSFKWHSPSGAGRVDLRADVGPDLTPGRIRARETVSEPRSLNPSAIVPMNSYPQTKAKEASAELG